jgi:hypothetical protein
LASCICSAPRRSPGFYWITGRTSVCGETIYTRAQPQAAELTKESILTLADRHTGRCEPKLEEWTNTAVGQLKKLSAGIAVRAGINPNAPAKVRRAQAKAAAGKQMEESMQQAQDMLKYMGNIEGMPGVQKAKIAEAKKKLAEVSKQKGIELEDRPVDMSAAPPGTDSGGLFAEENWIFSPGAPT